MPQGRMSRKVKALATSGVRLDGCVANRFDFVCWLSTLLSGFSVVDLCPVSCPFPFFLTTECFGLQSVYATDRVCGN